MRVCMYVCACVRTRFRDLSMIFGGALRFLANIPIVWHSHTHTCTCTCTHARAYIHVPTHSRARIQRHLLFKCIHTTYDTQYTLGSLHHTRHTPHTTIHHTPHATKQYAQVLLLLIVLFWCVVRNEHAHTRAHKAAHTHTHTRTYIEIRMCMHVLMHMQFAYKCAYKYTYTHMLACTHVDVHTCT